MKRIYQKPATEKIQLQTETLIATSIQASTDNAASKDDVTFDTNLHKGGVER